MINEIFNAQNLFLIGVVVIWLVAAIIQDFRKREVANWWSFSMIIFVLIYRAFLSISEKNSWYFLWGLIGVGIGFAIANIFYYARFFAGGDAKLMLGLSAALPLSLNWLFNLKILVSFLVLFLLSGGFYGIIYSSVLTLRNINKFKKEFKKQFKTYRHYVFYLILVGILFVILFSYSDFFIGIWFAILIAISPLLLIYAKAIEEACMIISVNAKELTIGDWLAKSIKIKGKKIEPNWQGLNEKELNYIQKNHKGKVLVKYGIPFTPTFLIAFIGVLVLLCFDFALLFL